MVPQGLEGLQSSTSFEKLPSSLLFAVGAPAIELDVAEARNGYSGFGVITGKISLIMEPLMVDLGVPLLVY